MKGLERGRIREGEEQRGRIMERGPERGRNREGEKQAFGGVDRKMIGEM